MERTGQKETFPKRSSSLGRDNRVLKEGEDVPKRRKILEAGEDAEIREMHKDECQWMPMDFGE